MTEMPEAPRGHRWSGWPGAWCLDCGKEDRGEVELTGGHRYTEAPHTGDDCTICDDGACAEPYSHAHDPYYRKERENGG